MENVHYAFVTWNGTHDMADEEFVHVVSTRKGREEAEAMAQKWGETHLSPAGQAGMAVRYIGKTDH